jgi:diadenosine tetraphosphate (Ap4A) HIT family hydrolase
VQLGALAGSEKQLWSLPLSPCGPGAVTVTSRARTGRTFAGACDLALIGPSRRSLWPYRHGSGSRLGRQVAGSYVSHREFARAFARMVPGSRDVLLVGSSPADAVALVREGLFVLRACSPGEAGWQATIGSPFLVERRFGPAKLPLSPGLFAAAWLRFSDAIDDGVLSDVFRLLMPGGLMALITPGAENASEYQSFFPEHHLEGGLKVVGAARLQDPMNLEAMIVMRTDDNCSPNSQTGCIFCPPHRFSINRHAKLPGAAGSIWGDEKFVLIPDVAPVFEGHLLLVPMEHHLSMGAMPYKELDRLEGYAAKVDDLMQLAFQRRALFIEHGAVRSNDGGSCIDHAHWHCLPDYGVIFDELLRRGMSGVEGPLSTVRDSYENDRSYLLVRSQDKNWYFSASNLPCQFLRFVASRDQGRSELRWQNRLASQENRIRYRHTLETVLPAADTLLAALQQ